jgi:hypothetical protein
VSYSTNVVLRQGDSIVNTGADITAILCCLSSMLDAEKAVL